jgi:hypothetical protein
MNNPLETIEQANARYNAAAHAMQSGVRFMQETVSTDGTPKHLRVGVNSALVAEAALARLLIAKGVITEQEHAIAQANEMERERDRYASLCSKVAGRPVTLG